MGQNTDSKVWSLGQDPTCLVSRSTTDQLESCYLCLYISPVNSTYVFLQGQHDP